MLKAGMLTGGRGAAALAAVGALSAGCNKDENSCVRVVCDFTRVAVSIVDADGEVGNATTVSFTVHPYNTDGQPMTEDELDEAGVDITEKRDAACVLDNDDNCSLWNAAAGFGDYTISGFLNDDETGEQLDTDLISVPLPYPDGQPDDCCGYTNSVSATMTLDKDGEVVDSGA